MFDNSYQTSDIRHQTSDDSYIKKHIKSDIRRVITDLCCHITLIGRLISYNCYQTSDFRHETSDNSYNITYNIRRLRRVI